MHVVTNCIQLETYYNLTYTVVSLIFLAPFVGYTTAAMLNNTIHMNLGQRGVAFIAPICRILAYVFISIHPPYPILPFLFMLAGFGNVGFLFSLLLVLSPKNKKMYFKMILRCCYLLVAKKQLTDIKLRV